MADLKKRNPVERLTIANTLIQSVIADFPTQSNAPNTLETLDCISRQAAIEALACLDDYEEEAIEALRKLPSAQPERCEDCRNFNKARLLIPQPERKKGKWIYLNGLDAFECSVCGRQMVRNIFDYCPWCGVEMTKGEEDE